MTDCCRSCRPTARITFSRLPKSVNLGIINVLKSLAPHKPRIAQPDQNDESGAPVSVGQTFELLGEADAGAELGAQIGDRHGDLSGHRIAPALDSITTTAQRLAARTDTGLAPPHVRELVKKGEHLPSLGIPGVDENEGRRD